MKPGKLNGGAIFMTPDGRVILQRRDNKPWISSPGKVHVFGGSSEGHETARQAMVREIHEETGLKLSNLHEVQFVDEFEELNDITGLVDTDEIYLIKNVDPHELRVLEGDSHVILSPGDDLSDYPLSELVVRVLHTIGFARS